MQATPTITHSFVFTHKGNQEVRLTGNANGLCILVDAKVKGSKVSDLRMYQQLQVGNPAVAKTAIPAEWVAHLTAACIKHQFGFIA